MILTVFDHRKMITCKCVDLEGVCCTVFEVLSVLSQLVDEKPVNKLLNYVFTAVKPCHYNLCVK